MSAINMNSILNKARSYINSKSGQARINSTLKEAMIKGRTPSGKIVHTPEEAASKFIEVLRNSISSAGLSAGAIEAISDISHGSAHKIKDNTYIIDVYFAGDMSRPSLDEARYGSITDIADLFNNGVDHTMKPVYGFWHGKEIWSRTVIPGTHFIEQAVSDFMSNYASEYNVINISTE